MMTAISRISVLPSVGAWIGAAKSKFGGPIVSARALVEDTTPEEAIMADDAASTDQSRYQRLLDSELDRQFLTKVEREDSDALDRVRMALYGD